MLKKKHRGITSGEVTHIFKNSPSNGSPFFRIFWSETSFLHSQFVVITSRKFHNSAVVRNRFRRFVYSVLEHHYSDWTRGLRVAILVKNASHQTSFKNLRRILLQQLEKAQIIHQ